MFLSTLHSLPSSTAILMLATSECPWDELPAALREVFEGVRNACTCTVPEKIDMQCAPFFLLLPPCFLPFSILPPPFPPPTSSFSSTFLLPFSYLSPPLLLPVISVFSSGKQQIICSSPSLPGAEKALFLPCPSHTTHTTPTPQTTAM